MLSIEHMNHEQTEHENMRFANKQEDRECSFISQHTRQLKIGHTSVLFLEEKADE